MRSLKNKSISLLLLIIVAAVTWITAAQPVFAASTDTTSNCAGCFMPQGGNTTTANGEYVSNTLNSFYSYYLEVPSGLSRLVVDLFDSDVGAGGVGEAGSGPTSRDRQRGGSWDTTATYTLIDPSGTARTALFTTGSSAAPAGADNAWLTFYDSSRPYFVRVDTNVTADGAASVTVTYGTATVANDFLVATLVQNSNTGTIATPSGWTLVNEGACPGAANTCRLGVFYRVAGAGETSVTLTPGAAAKLIGGVLRYQNVDTTTPMNGTAAPNTGTSNTPQAPSITTAVNNAMVVRVMGAGDNTWSSNPAGHDSRFGVIQGGGGSDISGAAADALQATAGATGTANFGLSESDNWRTVTLALRPSSTVPNGHWELRIDQSAAGDDINALGIRAHDGTSGSGGTEINVYFNTHAEYGVNPPGAGTVTRTYTHFPYITSGCTFSENDFDYDNAGSVQFTSPTRNPPASFTQTIAAGSLSADNVWARTSLSGWTSDSAVANSSTVRGYGIWTMSLAISSYISGGQNGNYTNFYAGTFQAGANPPGASPSSFRVYIPTDGGAAPPKPYLEQFADWRSGPNPPVIGSTTRARIEVFVVNPTAWPITFSTPTNIVTSNVPGGTVLYAGSGSVTQGSIVSQPAVGGSGNVTWNPGTVAAGTSAVLSYDINFTPTAAGTVAVTGTPASNGTRGQFVDETGNTTQARATFLFGPLCQLSMGTTITTDALISDFRVTRSSQGAIVEWDTASEVGTIGFDLLRGNVKVNDRLLPSLVQTPQGGKYRFMDRGARTDALEYTLVEVMYDGRRQAYGPYRVSPKQSRRMVPAPVGDFDRLARQEPDSKELAAGRSEEQTYRILTSAASGATAIKIGIDKEGLYFVSAGEIASHLGATTSKVQQLIAANQLSLKNRGNDVSWIPAAGNAGILFYGEAIDSIYTRENVYWLRKGRGQPIVVVSGGSPAPAGPAGFPLTEHVEKDNIGVLVLPLDPNSDYWFWDYLDATDPSNSSKSFALPVTGLGSSGNPATLRVSLQGATISGITNEHHAVVRLNGTQVGETSWTGISRQEVEFTFDESLLHEGANTVEVTALHDAGVPNSLFFVDDFDLTRARTYTVSDDRLAFRGSGNPVVTVDGFSDPDISVFDVSDRLHPKRVQGVTIDGLPGNYRVSLAPSSPDTEYVATTTAGLGTALWIRNDAPSNLRIGGTDYLIITPGWLAGPAGDMASYRSAHGLSSTVVDLEDIMDEFSHGIQNPYAIRDFLLQASQTWNPAPRYVLLAGDGSYDYKDNLGYGGNVVPLVMRSSPKGLFPADNRFADLAGDDGVPEMSIGRLPVRNETEFRDYLDKLIAYEASNGKGWLNRMVFAADDPDAGGDFPATSETVAGFLPGNYKKDRVYLPGAGLDAERARLLGFMTKGLAYMNYGGHGGIDRLASEGLLTNADVAALPITYRTPVLTTLTCLINRFELPFFSSLGEQLVRKPGGGMIATWGPTGMSMNDQATFLGSRFYGILALQDEDSERLGDVVRGALQSFAGAGGSLDMLDVYTVLGDPALKLKKPPELQPPPGGGPRE